MEESVYELKVTQTFIINTLIGVLTQLEQPNLIQFVYVITQKWTVPNLSSQLSALISFLTQFSAILISLKTTPLEIFFNQIASIVMTLWIPALSNFVTLLNLNNPDHVCPKKTLESLEQYWIKFLEEMQNIITQQLQVPGSQPGSAFIELMGIQQFVSATPQYNKNRVTHHYHNFNDTRHVRARNFFFPTNVTDLQQMIIANPDKQMRVVNSISNTFNDIFNTDDFLIIMENMPNTITIDSQTQTPTVTAPAQVLLRDVCYALLADGLAFENMGNWDGITVGGALSTAVHGSNYVSNDSFCAQCQSVTFVDMLGNLNTISQSDADFPAVVCGIGSIGVLVSATFNVVPNFNLSVIYEPVSGTTGNTGSYITEFINNYIDVNNNFPQYIELDFFPCLFSASGTLTNNAFMVRQRTPTVSANTSADPTLALFDKVIGFTREILTRLSNIVADPTYGIQNLNTALLVLSNTTSQSNVAFQGFENNYFSGTSLPVTIDNAEYAFNFITLSDLQTLMVNIANAFITIQQNLLAKNILIYITYRFQGGTANNYNAYMDPTTGNTKTVYVDLAYLTPLISKEDSMYVEQMMIQMGGRPHWGKRIDLKWPLVEQIYTQQNVQNFLTVRQKYDPNNQLVNSYIKRIFNLSKIH